MLVVMKNYENSKSALEGDFKQANSNLGTIDAKEMDRLREKINVLEKNLTQQQLNITSEKTKYEELAHSLTKTKETLDKMTEDKNQLSLDATKVKEQCEKITKEKKKLEEENAKIKEELSKSRQTFAFTICS